MGIEYRQVGLKGRIGSAIGESSLDFLFDSLHLLLEVECINEIREVLDIILVIHLGKLLEDNELVDARVDLLASAIFE